MQLGDVRFVPIADITSFGDLGAVKTSMTSADFQSEGDRPRIIFSLSLLFYQREIPKKLQNNNSMTSCLFGSGTESQHNTVRCLHQTSRLRLRYEEPMPCGLRYSASHL